MYESYPLKYKSTAKWPEINIFLKNCNLSKHASFNLKQNTNKHQMQTIQKTTHSLLKSQMEKHLGTTTLSRDMESFIEAIETTYYTHEKEVERLHDLEKTNRELDQFAYIVSHDLKAPLRAMSSLVTWIEEDSEKHMTDESKEHLQMVVGRIHRMENLIQGILAYSKAGKNKEVKEPTDVKILVNEVIDSHQVPDLFIINNQVNVSVIETEKIKLSQVFSNLISNAIKYNDKPNGEIEIGSFEQEDCCQFYVQDNGPGIEKQYHEKVFMIFQTLLSRDEVESTGIGLSIVKKIVEEQNGKIWIESGTGQGSRFVFTWPKTNTLKTK